MVFCVGTLASGEHVNAEEAVRAIVDGVRWLTTSGDTHSCERHPVTGYWVGEEAFTKDLSSSQGVYFGHFLQYNNSLELVQDTTLIVVDHANKESYGDEIPRVSGVTDGKSHPGLAGMVVVDVAQLAKYGLAQLVRMTQNITRVRNEYS